MRSVVSRLARLEREVRTSGRRRITVQYGYLKTLPEEYTGPRYVATVRQLPPGPGGEDWFDWEERPGPESASNATGPDDGLVRV